MVSMLRCRKGWLIGSLLVFGFLTFLLIPTIFYAGNPQWNRWIYIFQAYVIHKDAHQLEIFNDDLWIILSPDDHNGTWYMWHRNGQLFSQENCLNGLAYGTMTCWHPNGQIAEICSFWNGRPHGKTITWDCRGNLMGIETFRHGKLHGESIQFMDGVFSEFDSYEDNLKSGWSFESDSDMTPPELNIDYVQYHEKGKLISSGHMHDLLPDEYWLDEPAPETDQHPKASSEANGEKSDKSSANP